VSHIPEIFIDKVSKRYKTRRHEVLALNDITLRLPESGIAVISGPSGSGKSSLIRTIAGLETPTTGRVYVEGIDITRLGAYEMAWFRRKKFGFKPQDPKLIPYLTLVENVALPLLLNYTPESVAFKVARELISEVGLEDRADHKPTEVSGGEYERASLAQTIIGSPPIVILDEPTAHQDPETSARIAEMIKAQQRKLNSLYIVTTLEESIIEGADQMISICKGKVTRS